MSQKENDFSKVRGALWPIHNFELKKFLPMGLMMLCILFNYTMMRDTKDALLASAPNSSTEIFNFIKFFIVMPSAVLFVIMYAKLTNLLSRASLFNWLVGVFISFFGIFGYLLYPNIDILHPSAEVIQTLQTSYPSLYFPIAMYGNWTFVLFYMMSELWGSVMISLLFWQFANEITRTHEAKRFYAMFGLIANLALIFSGWTVHHFSDIKDKLPAGVDPWSISLKYLMAFIVIAGLVTIYINVWMEKNVLTDPRYYDDVEPKKKKKDKPKLSIGESFRYIVSSPYIGFIAVLVLAYGMSINLIEVVWKKQIKLNFHGNANDINAFMGMFSMFTGTATIFLILFTKGIVRRYGWFTGAIITPIMIAVTGGLFFFFIFSRDSLGPIMDNFGISIVAAAVYLGMIQNILSKGTKYSLFDPTKEMSYIPLDPELKVKGKAAVDVIGGRLGKAGGSIVTITLLTVFAQNDIMMLLLPLVAFIALVIMAWVWAATRLSKLYNALLKNKYHC
ncbi:NTP/NDP exchange transporter [Alphaproteobacteria bacterium]|nr:NTP/NDP exchange transporter [Alphaproteobacteria bacterium]